MAMVTDPHTLWQEPDAAAVRWVQVRLPLLTSHALLHSTFLDSPFSSVYIEA